MSAQSGKLLGAAESTFPEQRPVVTHPRRSPSYEAAKLQLTSRWFAHLSLPLVARAHRPHPGPS